MKRDSSTDYYELLEVDPDATRAEIRDAVQRLSQGAGDAEQVRLLEAQEILTDPGRRYEYDQTRPVTVAEDRTTTGKARTTGADTRDASPDDDARSARAPDEPPVLDRKGRPRPTRDRSGSSITRTPMVFDEAPPKPSAMQADEARMLVYLAAFQAAAGIGIAVANGEQEGAFGFMAINVVLAVAIAASSRLRNRFVAMAASLAGGFLGLGTVIILIIPHYGLVIWVMVRQNRAARVWGEWRRQERAGLTSASPSRPARSPDRASNRAPDEEDDEPVRRSRGRSKRKGRPEPGRSLPAPTASKRYTPPKKKTKRR